MELKSATLCLSLMLLAITGTQAWLAQGIYHKDEHPGKCVISDTLILSPGQKIKDPNNCSTITCNNAEGWATHTGCGAIMAPPNCKWDGYVNIHERFPVCCVQKIKCDNPADFPYAEMMQQSMKEMFSKQSDNNQVL